MRVLAQLTKQLVQRYAKDELGSAIWVDETCALINGKGKAATAGAWLDPDQVRQNQVLQNSTVEGFRGHCAPTARGGLSFNLTDG